MTIYEDYAAFTGQYKIEYGEQTLVLIEVGSFWELYNCDKGLGADMKTIGELLNIQVSKKNKAIKDVSANNPYMAGFPSHALGRFLPMLINADYTVVLVSQVTPPPNCQRKVTQILSKGTYVDSVNSATSNYIMCTYGVHGASLIDLCNGTSFTYEGTNTDDLYKIIATFNPCEIIQIDNNSLTNAKTPVKTYNNVSPICKIHLQTDILNAAFENNSMLSIIEYLDLELSPNALISFVTLVDFCQKHNPSVVLKLKKPTPIKTSDYLDMYYNTIEQLDVEGLNRVLNKCVTAMGRRYFHKRLLHPFASSVLINDSLDQIKSMPLEEAVTHRKMLGNVYDLERLFRKMELGLLLITELQNVTTSCASVVQGMPLAKYIDDSVDFGGGSGIAILKDKELEAITKSIEQLSESIVAKMDEFNKDYSVDYFKVEKSERDGYYMTFTTKRYKELLKKKDLGFEGKAITSANQVKVFHPFLDEISVKEERLEKEFKSLQSEKYKLFLENTNNKFNDVYTIIVDTICQLDWTSTCVINNHVYKYVCPKVDKEGEVAKASFKGIRHPIIERVNDAEVYVGNDISINGNGILLYGLNAAGKSSLMKAVGLNIIMAQCGMYVASSELELVPYSSLFARISKSDNLYAGQSTFMVEMSELRKILANSNANSLVLADELCAGTESISAISIVSSAICCLATTNTAFIFATHLHELTKIPRLSPHVDIFHLDVHFDKAADLLVYNRKLIPGQGSELYGLEVCKALNMDDTFLTIANEIRNTIMKSPRKTKYNSKVLVDKCKICSAQASEVHHIVEQHTASPDGFIGVQHKNHKSNLVALCNSCHDQIHKKELNIEGYKWTNRGLMLLQK